MKHVCCYGSRALLFAALTLGFLSGCGESDKIPGFQGDEAEVPFRVFEVPDSLVIEEDVATEEILPWDDLRVVSWNLRNFSPYGTSENRLAAMISTLEELDADLILLQELLPTESEYGQADSAFVALKNGLDGFEGFRGEWQGSDSSVGMLYRKSRLELVEQRELFADNQYAFPRPALLAFFVAPDQPDAQFGAISLHLKSYEEDGSDVDRRKEACAILQAYLDTQTDVPFLIGGDFNDSPLDPEEQNVFLDTFLNEEKGMIFPTSLFDDSAYTFGGTIDGVFVGLFLDHFVYNGALGARYATVDVTILPISLEELISWIPTHSDHLPIAIDFLNTDRIRL